MERFSSFSLNFLTTRRSILLVDGSLQHLHRCLSFHENHFMLLWCSKTEISFYQTFWLKNPNGPKIKNVQINLKKTTFWSFCLILWNLFRRACLGSNICLHTQKYIKKDHSEWNKEGILKTRDDKHCFRPVLWPWWSVCPNTRKLWVQIHDRVIPKTQTVHRIAAFKYPFPIKQ